MAVEEEVLVSLAETAVLVVVRGHQPHPAEQVIPQTLPHPKETMVVLQVALLIPIMVVAVAAVHRLLALMELQPLAVTAETGLHLLFLVLP